MGRSATNVVGNSVASVVVARWEGEISDHDTGDSGHDPSPPDPRHPVPAST
jgi:Na+/H+-dicarboxylate symporter